MIPSLAHLSVLAIPRDVNLTIKQQAVLRNIQWDAGHKLSTAVYQGQQLNSEFRTLRARYENSLKCGINDDIDDMCDELRQLFDEAMAYRNEMSRESLWSSNYVYMDWLISKVLFSPTRWTESEELFHMLKGSCATWKKISPKFNLTSYTATEREFHGLIIKFKSASFRSYITLDKSSSNGIDDITGFATPLIDNNRQSVENGRQKIFLKRITLKLDKYVPYYYTFTDPDLEEGEIYVPEY